MSDQAKPQTHEEALFELEIGCSSECEHGGPQWTERHYDHFGDVRTAHAREVARAAAGCRIGPRPALEELKEHLGCALAVDSSGHSRGGDDELRAALEALYAYIDGERGELRYALDQLEVEIRRQG